MNFRISIRLLLALFSGGGLFRLTAAEVILHPVADSSILEANPQHSAGQTTLVAGRTLQSGPARTRGLLKFDVAAGIPAGAVITNVTLQLEVVRRPMYGPVASTFDLFRVLLPWGEGGQGGSSGAPAAAGEATWNARLHGLAAWGQPGGLSGTDFATNASSSAFAVDALGAHTFPRTPALVADVQKWLDHPAANQGWMLISQEEDASGTARRFGDLSDADRAPRLRIGYLAKPQFLAVTHGEGQVGLVFLAPSNQAHTVQFRESLQSNVWQTLTNFAALPVVTNRTATDPAPGVGRFYRVTAP